MEARDDLWKGELTTTYGEGGQSLWSGPTTPYGEDSRRGLPMLYGVDNGYRTARVTDASQEFNAFWRVEQ